MTSPAAPARLSIALTLLLGAFAHNAIAHVTVNNDGTVLRVQSVIGGTMTDYSGTTPVPASRPVGPPLSGIGTVGSRTGALTMDANDMLNGIWEVPMRNSDSLTVKQGAFIPERADIFSIAQNTGTKAVRETFTPSLTSKSTALPIDDANGNPGVIESDVVFEAVPETSTWCFAALTAAFVVFQSCRKLKERTEKMRLVGLPPLNSGIGARSRASIGS